MANKSYILPTGILLLAVLPTVFPCSCKPNLKADACKSDYVIVAKVVDEQQMTSHMRSVSRYGLNVSNVLKTSEQYEGAEKVIQTKSGGPAGCEVRLKTGHTYLFSGHVGKFEDEGTTKQFLEVRFCNYVDFEDMAKNKELADDIMDMIENPPACVPNDDEPSLAYSVTNERDLNSLAKLNWGDSSRKSRAERAEKLTDPVSSFSLTKRGRWNHPFLKRWSNPFQKRWSNPFQKRWNNPFQKRWNNPFQKRWNNPFQKRLNNPNQKRMNKS
ncbi:uncharacterized protein LOC132714396 isoform X2 [Ruditapes philippinarum]|uniref:uncharacterized protein LOC132714396 isoform X2 n=1 Tax=Ruditapes philippinarum TaxID=129788 RepID=UPI00295BCE47|nr:uncharacterized protein LOC132714396 isoform X2 [Ruditapes philippinarum]